jgi:hypothetical protein
MSDTPIPLAVDCAQRYMVPPGFGLRSSALGNARSGEIPEEMAPSRSRIE